MNRAWLFIGLGALVVIAAFALYSYLALERMPPPRIEVLPSSYDFGVIPYRAVEKSFTVRNAGGSPLKIMGISTSCGCTRAELEREELLPGEETELLVTFDPNLMEEHLTGRIYRVVYIKSNDPERPEVEIELWATLEEGDEG